MKFKCQKCNKITDRGVHTGNNKNNKIVSICAECAKKENRNNIDIFYKK